ncbi:MAG: methyltransferase [Myxococcota bacterium]
MSWEDAWREGRTRWDAGQSPPVLLEMLAHAPTGRALVPGCGSGYDVFALAAADRRVIGLDVAPTAAERFQALRREREIDETRAGITIGDFFSFEPEAKFDLIWDYTFLCALPVDLREAWAKTMARLLAPTGELWTLIFPVVPQLPDEPTGPPFPMRPELVQGLLAHSFTEIEMRPVERSHPGREGKEWFARWSLNGAVG